VNLLVIGAAHPPLEELATVRSIGDLAGGELALRAEQPDAVLLDADVADPAVVARLRREHPVHTLVSWLRSSSSARAAELLDAGADDVLDPTMSLDELRARLENAQRTGRPGGSVEAGGLRVDAAHGEATWNGRELRLTRREVALLQGLTRSAGRTVRREALYREVWGYTMARGDRAVDVNVNRLRDKLKAAGAEFEIKTQPGVGYRLELAAVTAL
jgi:DNA-binding response OmpR family regulator